MRHDQAFPRMTGPDHPEVTPGPVEAPVQPVVARWRRPLGVTLGVVWIALYNWWVPVAFDRRLMTSPDEFFSDLEATGRPDATLLQHLDLAAGIVLVVALLVRGPIGRTGRRSEWSWLLAMAVAGAVGGQYAYACPEGLSASCRAAEWRLALPPHHYVHVVAGIAEFTFGTMAVYRAWQRTRPRESGVTRAVRWTGRVLVFAYPVLGIAYLTDRFGAFVEPIFFTCFSVMVAVELLESARVDRPGGPDRTAVPLPPRARGELDHSRGG